MNLKKTLMMAGLAITSIAAPIKNAEAAPRRAARPAPIHHVHHSHKKAEARAFVGGLIGGFISGLVGGGTTVVPAEKTVVVKKKVVVQTPVVQEKVIIKKTVMR